MNVKLLSCVAVVVLCLCSVPMVLDDSASADVPSQPDADVSLTVVSKTYLTDSPSESFHLLDMGDLGREYVEAGEIIASSSHQGNLEIDASGLPSWISYHVPSEYDLSNDVYFTVSPGAPCDETFWIWFDAYNGDTSIILLFDIVVEDSGSVIPTENYTFVLNLNTNGGDPLGPLSAESKDRSHTFDISGCVPMRDGFSFKGWASDPNGEAMLSGSVTVTISGDSSTASRTVYAVWEENDYSLTIPTFWDGLIELLSNPIILLLGLIMFLAVCLFIRNRTGGYA